MGQAQSASPRRGAPRPPRTPYNTPYEGPGAPHEGRNRGHESLVDQEDRDLIAALEASELDHAIKESLRCSPNHDGRPEAATPPTAQSPNTPSVGTRLLEETDQYFSPFVPRSADSVVDEATDRALAVALAEQDGELVSSRPPNKQQDGQVLSDEEVARELQRQLDAEAVGPLAGATPPGQTTNGVGKASPASGGLVCAGCMQPVRLAWLSGGRSCTQAMGLTWHPECFICNECKQPIKDPSFAARDGIPYHTTCHKKRFHPWCAVCCAYMRPQADGRVSYSENAFWGVKYCQEHLHDGTPRCYSCNRFQTQGEEYVRLQDGRFSCLTCVDSIVVDTADCQPLYEDVLMFFHSLGMPLPKKPPLMLVEAGALNAAEDKEGIGHRQGPIFHTRGLCLSEVHHQVSTVRRARGGPFHWFVVPEEVHIPSTTARVTAILVLFGMPRILTGSVIAHELMHAWLKLAVLPAGMFLSPVVEEGICQLMAHLWLQAQQPQMLAMQGHGTAELVRYCLHQIEKDPSPVYGDGFRLALHACQAIGLGPLLSHIRLTGCFPEVA